MRKLSLIGAFVALFMGASVDAQTKATPAIDGILAAFKTHPLVGMENDEGADNHDLAQQEDFYAALVRDPRFAREVGNVVVEFGDASAQGIIDRYVDGKDVPYTELRKVWTDTVGWTPPPIDLGYVNFLAQVRATNLSLPSAQRIHIWLGEPPVDWSKAKKREDVIPKGMDIEEFRDNFVADLIERQILSRGRKALVIYGGGHFLTDPLLLAIYYRGHSTMGALVERQHPGAIFKVFTYARAFPKATCTAAFEKDQAKLGVPALLTVRGTTLDDPSFRQRCPLWNVVPPPGMAKEKRAEFMDHATHWNTGLGEADALLYLGPAASLTESPIMPDAYLDDAYLKEIQRRWRIFGPDRATPSNMGITVDKNTASPRPFK